MHYSADNCRAQPSTSYTNGINGYRNSAFSYKDSVAAEDGSVFRVSSQTASPGTTRNTKVGADVRSSNRREKHCNNAADIVLQLQRYILDLAIFQACADVHYEAAMLLDAGKPPDALNLPPVEDPFGQMARLRMSVPNSDEVVIQCPECNKAMACKIFAQHLEQHSGGGRNSSRTARKRLQEEQQLCQVKIGSDDDENSEAGPLLSPISTDDDDWKVKKKKKKAPAKKRKKPKI